MKLTRPSESAAQLRRRAEEAETRLQRLDTQLQETRDAQLGAERDRDEARRESERRRLQLETLTADKEQLEKAKAALSAQVSGRSWHSAKSLMERFDTQLSYK